MKFTVSRENLQDAFARATPASRANDAVLCQALMESGPDGTTITATDHELEIKVSTDDKAAENCRFCLPIRAVSGLCSTLPPDATVRLQVGGPDKRHRTQLSSGQARLSLAGTDPDAFPVIEDLGNTTQFRVPAQALYTLLAFTHHAMAAKDVRYYLNGVSIERRGKSLVAAATDGHRLAVRVTDTVTGPGENRDVIVPHKGANAMRDMLKNADGDVLVEMSANHLRLTVANTVLTTKLVDGRFPDYRTVTPQIPAAERKAITAPVEDMKVLLNRLSLLSTETAILTVGPETLSAHTSSKEDIGEVNDSIAVTCDGNPFEPFEIGINRKYLQDALSAIESEQVHLIFRDAEYPLLMTGDAKAQIKDAYCVIMPLRT